MPLEAPPGALSHFLLAGCLWFSTSSLLLWLWLLLAFARPLLPLLPLISYTTCPLPLCVVIAPFFLAFISSFEARAKEIAAEVALLFVHLGLDAVDSVVSGYTGAEVFASYKRDAAVLPEDERQIMVFMTRFSFMPRLNCVSRNLPSSISTDPLRMVDALAIGAVAACAGLSSSQDLTEAQRGK